MSTTVNEMRDRVSGSLLVGIGLVAVIKAQTGLHVGSLANMGPGFFPIILGSCLVLTGTCLFAATFRSKQTSNEDVANGSFVSLRSVGLVVLAVALFTLTVRPIGLIPASFLLVATSAMADLRTKPKTALWLAAGLAVVSWLIFIVALGMPLSAFSVWQ